METEIPADLKPMLFDGQLFSGKWGEIFFVSKNRISYTDMASIPAVSAVNDTIYGRYFLQDIEPAWQRDTIMRDLYRYAKPWATDLSGLDSQQLIAELLHLFQQDELRVWQLTDGWASPPEPIGGNTYTPVGSGAAAKASSTSSATRSSTASKPKGGGTAAPQPVAAKTAGHEAGDNARNPADSSAPTQQDIALAKSEGTTSSHLQAREKVSRYFLEQHGFSENQIANAIGDEEAKIEGGVDLTKPVEVISFPPPDEMTQYVKSHGFPGNWFDPTSSQTPDELGLSGEGRTLTSFQMPPGNGLQSHSKPIIDDWTNPANPVSTAGGGKQLFVNDETKKAVITLNKIGM